ncbi:MAG: acetate--CoA ligase family protein [Bacteroidales bacterium]|nr:acetate--CoA ligase family protein [Bacteroidales bacterium]
MISKELIQPTSITIVGASNDIRKPGGKVVKNLLDSKYQGKLFVVNPKETEVQGLKAYPDVRSIPPSDLAVLAIAAKFCPETVEILAKEKNVKAFIIFSAGFSEESHEGKLLEEEIVKIVNEAGATLIGPNCIGVMTPYHASVFTTPIPKLEPGQIDFISGSGATAVFIMESSIPLGLKFSNVFSVGNSAQVGVEDILEYLDQTYEEGKSAPIKLLYLETIKQPQKLLQHARSLVSKGCRIAAIKAGSSEAGGRAASSHTGAMATNDAAVEALFRKAGIIRCHGRSELATMASVFKFPRPQGKNVAIVTHAGGPAVMLTDALSNEGVHVPPIDHPAKNELAEKLFPGSSVNNPIDFLATGTAEQLDHILHYCINVFDQIHAIPVIFGSPGLFEVYDAYDVLDKHIKTSHKPIYPILPSVMNVAREIQHFIEKENVFFPDEVIFGKCFAKYVNTFIPKSEEKIPMNEDLIAKSLNGVNGYISPEKISFILDGAGIPRVREIISNSEDELIEKVHEIGFPVVMKVVGPIHKTDVGGVVLNINSESTLREEFKRLMQIPSATSVLVQPMIKGIELFMGSIHEGDFGHLLMFGLGGIFVETLKDVSYGLAPLSQEEAMYMIQSIRSNKMLDGVRGFQPINKAKLAEILVRLSWLVKLFPQIKELDLNPIIADGDQIYVVDARIKTTL